MTSPSVIRPMKLSDLDQVLLLDQAIHSHPWSRASYISSLNSTHVTWVVEQCSEVRASLVASQTASEAEVLMLSVRASYQRAGIGSLLINALIEYVKDAADSLFLEVRVSNYSAITFYQALGFVEVGLRPKYYPGSPPEDALIMAYTL